MHWKWKLLSIILILLFTAFMGVYYVAPKGICKKPLVTNTSQPDDFGMHYDLIYAISDDSLELCGDFIYPFNHLPGEQPPNNALIVIHPHKTMSTISYRYIKPLVDFPLNVITFDSRGIDRSEGDYFTFGVKESQDISAIIDRVLELYPNMRFGIYALQDSGNVALKAMENDKRIKYGIVEHAFRNSKEYLYHYSGYDIGLTIPVISDIIENRSLSYLKVSKEQIGIQADKINQPILFLDVEGESDYMKELYKQVDSSSKFYANIDKAKFHGHYYPDFDDKFYQCIYEFIINFAIL